MRNQPAAPLAGQVIGAAESLQSVLLASTLLKRETPKCRPKWSALALFYCFATFVGFCVLFLTSRAWLASSTGWLSLVAGAPEGDLTKKTVTWRQCQTMSSTFWPVLQSDDRQNRRADGESPLQALGFESRFTLS